MDHNFYLKRFSIYQIFNETQRKLLSMDSDIRSMEASQQQICIWNKYIWRTMRNFIIDPSLATGVITTSGPHLYIQYVPGDLTLETDHLECLPLPGSPKLLYNLSWRKVAWVWSTPITSILVMRSTMCAASPPYPYKPRQSAHFRDLKADLTGFNGRY